MCVTKGSSVSRCCENIFLFLERVWRHDSGRSSSPIHFRSIFFSLYYFSFSTKILNDNGNDTLTASLHCLGTDADSDADSFWTDWTRHMWLANRLRRETAVAVGWRLHSTLYLIVEMMRWAFWSEMNDVGWMRIKWKTGCGCYRYDMTRSLQTVNGTASRFFCTKTAVLFHTRQRRRPSDRLSRWSRTDRRKENNSRSIRAGLMLCFFTLVIHKKRKEK